MPVWVCLPFAPDWRWQRGREDTPWYPTGRLFRQPRRGDWDAVLARATEQLGATAKQARPIVPPTPAAKPSRPDDASGAQNNRGVELARRGQLDEAVACFREACRLNPEGATGFANLGLALLNQGIWPVRTHNASSAPVLTAPARERPRVSRSDLTCLTL